ncbi:crotonase/enoyl-CoA hydratase family protein [Sulfitobacter sp. PM12]|jgi:enoyl-CoA hydratase|uniref:crotonase/enoyl-CoA hydratase family protein n=1 Tax=Sulfitobacter sp. PM12 TaxID=3138497 RepID=UPI0038909338
MSYIKTETDGHVLIITLDRPDARNAFNLAMSEELEAIIDRYENDIELRCAIIQANGPTFSAGQDLIAAAKGERSVTKGRGGFGIMGRPPNKPLIAAVEGQALAGGMELTLCCDMVVASTGAVFGLAEAKRGLVAIGGGCFRLPHRIPHNIAMEMIITAEPRSAEDMHSFGYVNKLVEPGNTLEGAMEYAALVVRNGPLATVASKEIAHRSATEQWRDEDGWRIQEEIIKPVLASDDLKEGLAAFAEKRDPVWKGK